MTNVFADLREKYFSLPRTGANLITADVTEPWCAIMEIGYPQAIVTTVAFSDGTVSVLRSTGGGFFGGGDKAVQGAGKEFLKQACLSRSLMQPAGDHLSPSSGDVSFFLRTDGGVSAATLPENNVKVPGHPLFQFYCAGLRIPPRVPEASKADGAMNPKPNQKSEPTIPPVTSAAAAPAAPDGVAAHHCCYTL